MRRTENVFVVNSIIRNADTVLFKVKICPLLGALTFWQLHPYIWT